MTTLEEALAMGRGVERPFQCFKHEDTTASASVNVTKNVWYCYVCKQGGVVDSNRVPTNDELLAMLEPEQACRTLPASWLNIYSHGGYWLDRFPDWVCWFMSLGEDPWTGEPTFPVHTPRGRLAGVGRRAAMPGPGPKYRYPPVWSASRSLFGTRGVWKPTPVVTLVEGAADASSPWEIGVPAWGCYGAGLHLPQRELVAALSPRLVLFGFDMDEAGERATEQSEQMIGDLAETARIEWSGNDPAELTPEQRMDDVLRTVRRTAYGTVNFEERAASIVADLKRAFVEEADG